MNWDAIGAIGEIVGALAVVLTLAYLAIEVRRNRLMSESNAVDALSAGLNQVNISLLNNPESAALWVEGFSDPDSLDTVNWTRFYFMGQTYLNHFVTIHKHYQTGALPEPEWLAYGRGMAHVFNSPGGRRVCEKAAVPQEVTDVVRGFLSYRDYEREGYIGIPSYEKPEV